MSQITIRLYPFYITESDTSLVDAVLKGLFPPGKQISESILGSVAIEILDESGCELDQRPPVLIPGFVDFAKALLENHPAFGFVADIHGNDFYRYALLAASGDMTAVQTGEQGVIVAQGEPYIAVAMAELEKFKTFAITRTDTVEMTLECHLHDLTEYLLFKPETL